MLILHSGGAAGSDTIFAKAALDSKCFSNVIAHSFVVHDAYIFDSPCFELRIHHCDALNRAEHYIVEANKTLKRHYPPRSDYVRKLLIRDVFQVLTTNCVFAVADLETGKSCVKGGTGWAVQIAINLGKDVFVFDRSMNKWRPYHGNKQSIQEHISNCIAARENQMDYEITGIGTRSPGSLGTNAIHELINSISS